MQVLCVTWSRDHEGVYRLRGGAEVKLVDECPLVVDPMNPTNNVAHHVGRGDEQRRLWGSISRAARLKLNAG